MQRVIFDDLSLPEFGVAEGEISTEYLYSPKRDVRWTMSNEYLRRYLWMRGTYGVRVFFYEAPVAGLPRPSDSVGGRDSRATKALRQVWYEFDIREHRGGLLIQVWASVVAVAPELSPEPSACGLVWPEFAQPMTHNRANALIKTMPVYLDDRFLERYEQSSFFDTRPVNVSRTVAL